MFVGITDALALIGFRGTIAADDGSGLTDLLLVGARDDDLGLARRCNLDAGFWCTTGCEKPI